MKNFSINKLFYDFFFLFFTKIDDDALRSVQIPYMILTKNQTFNTFSGINVDPSTYPIIGNLSSPLTNMTGTLERFEYDKLVV